MSDVPAPGSLEAYSRGCRCPMFDNARGKGRVDHEGKRHYVVASHCPIHGWPDENLPPKLKPVA